jgi:hypothetical protein
MEIVLNSRKIFLPKWRFKKIDPGRLSYFFVLLSLGLRERPVDPVPQVELVAGKRRHVLRKRALRYFVARQIATRQNVDFQIATRQNVDFQIATHQNVDFQIATRQNVDFEMFTIKLSTVSY